MGLVRRLVLAWVCCFRILLGRQLPEEARLLGCAETDTVPEPASEPAAAPRDDDSVLERGALLLLGLLQREGRFADFVQENLENVDDADLAAAAREVWRGCRKAIHQHMQLVPMIDAEEDTPHTVEPGFDPQTLRLTGKVRGDPPYHGMLRHPGWRARDVRLPQWSDGVDAQVVAAAEVEIGA